MKSIYITLILLCIIALSLGLGLGLGLKKDEDKEEKELEKKLKFIHITKCAGTFIEDLGKSYNIKWGRFHKEYGFWHNYTIPKNIKHKYDWFMIVRNPYTRILSEYYCKWIGIGEKNISHSKEEFNKYLIEKIKNRNSQRFHYMPQHNYLDKSINIEIIKFENMHDELTKLFKKNNLNITIPNKKTNSREQGNSKLLFTINDFSPELIHLINEVYDKDFKVFGYEKILDNLK